jgi:hypothetical protein
MPKELEVEHSTVASFQEWLQWVSEPKIINAVSARVETPALPAPTVEAEPISAPVKIAAPEPKQAISVETNEPRRDK